MERATSLAGTCLLAALAACLFGFVAPEGTRDSLEFVQGLRRDIVKVDHAISVTRELIDRSPESAYLPDAFFRLAELHVEKSRLVQFLRVETEGARAASVSPQTELLKDEAIRLYAELMHRFPGYRGNDKALFYMAHEYNELGMHADMLATYGKLIDEFPRSTLVQEAHFLVGDHHFNADDLGKAEPHYQRVLRFRPTPLHDHARYKLAWIAVNRARQDRRQWKVALSLFEQVASSSEEKDYEVDTVGATDVRQQALDGIVFCFTEVHPPRIALDYFQSLSASRQSYLHALGKLATRYFVKEEYDHAAGVYRRLIELSGDIERNLDYAQRIYDASAFSRSREHVDRDVEALGRAASRYAHSWRVPESTRQKLAADFAVYARDMATRLHLLARKRDEKHTYRTVARAYRAYLGHFAEPEHLAEVKSNFAEALFLSGQHLEAGRAYEDLAGLLADERGVRDALHSAIQAYQHVLADVGRLSLAERVEARQAIAQLGSACIRRYPGGTQVPTVKFNVARMLFEQGRYAEARKSFLAYLKRHPGHAEAKVAAHLVLDCHQRLRDPAGLVEAGRALLGDPQFEDATFRDEITARVHAAREKKLNDKTRELLAPGGDPAKELIGMADDLTPDEAQGYLRRAFGLAVKARDFTRALEAGARLARLQPGSEHLPGVYVTLGQLSLRRVDFERVAGLGEEFHAGFPGHEQARDALLRAARIRVRLGQHRKAARAYTVLLRGARGDERAKFLADLAEIHADARDWRMVMRVTRQAGGAAAPETRTRMLHARAIEETGKREEARDAYLAVASSDHQGEALVRLGELLFADYRRVEKTAPEEKIQAEQVAERVLSAAVESRDPRWVVAALVSLSDLHTDFAAFLEQVPIQGPDREQVEHAIAEQIEAQRKTAEAYRTACRKVVRERQVLGPWALACVHGHRHEAVPPRRVAASLDAGAVYRERLLENPKDVTALHALARLASREGDHLLARLILERLLDIRANHAPALNLMGVAAWHLGDEQEAHALLTRACAADPSSLPARLNLASLLHRYGSTGDARRMLLPVSKGLQTVDLSVPDIHPLAKQALREMGLR